MNKTIVTRPVTLVSRAVAAKAQDVRIRQLVRQAVREELAEFFAQLSAQLREHAQSTQYELDPKLVAVIAAAATAVLHRPVRVRGITFLNQNTVSGWVSMGRVSVQSSHNIRRAY